MRKRRMLWVGTLLFLLAAGGLGALALVLKHEPSYYRQARHAPGKERKDLSTAFSGRFIKLVNCLVDGGKEEWEITFSQAQVNSYLEEDFVRLGDAEALEKQGISEPRITFEDDHLRLGFRYGSGTWSTIVTYDLRLWLAPRDVNVMAVEILGRQAGGLPISAQGLLREITEMARRHNIEVTWYRHEGNPVALVRFQADRNRPSAQLRRLEVRHGTLTIGGRSLEAIPAGTAAGPHLMPLGN